MSFPLEAAMARGGAYKRGLERGGPYGIVGS